MEGLSRRPRSSWLLLGGAAAYALVLAAVVLLPVGRALNRLTVQMYVVWRYDLALPGDVLPENFGFVLNVLLFLPAALLVALAVRRPWWWVTLLGVATSAAIEAVQTVPALHRTASLADLAANSTGALLGALLAALWRRRAAHRS